MRTIGHLRSLKRRLKIAINGYIRTLLVSTTVIAVVRKLLRPFPSAEETVGVWIYFLKKKLVRSNVPIIYVKNTQTQLSMAPSEYQLLVDISELVLHDVHTGVQRVVRSILLELLLRPPVGYKVKAIYADAAGQLRYAQKFSSILLESANTDAEDSVVTVQPGDIFYCPDPHLSYPFATLAALQQRGLRIIFVIHDICAFNQGAYFPRTYELTFADWFAGVIEMSDGIICVSRAVADEVCAWLHDHPGQRHRPLPIGFVHNGADIEASQPTQGLEGEGAEVLAACHSRPTLLMVGTLEPRKGHAQALAAVEALWQAGVDLNLVIIGKEGWRTQRLARQLRRHPERNRRLFWLEKASDALLMRLYAQSTALLAASYAEGFGLPLIEAARQGLPIIARDIPVFHEVAGDFAFYFPNTDSAAIANSLRQWLRLNAEGKAPQSKDMPYLTWAQSTQQFLQVILENNWYTTYRPAEAHCNDRQR